jgi:predicted phage-related endonuclease
VNTITVNKEELLNTLERNQTQHETDYADALVAYRAKLIEELDQKLADAKAGKKVDHHLRLPIPESYAESFQTAIEMLQWDVAAEVQLDQRDFQRFVQNQWEWQHQFAASTAAYLV